MKIVAKCSVFVSLSYQVQVKVYNKTNIKRWVYLKGIDLLIHRWDKIDSTCNSPAEIIISLMSFRNMSSIVISLCIAHQMQH